MKKKIIISYKGGEGSGHFDHAGRPGKHGGSLPGKGSALENQYKKTNTSVKKIDAKKTIRTLQGKKILGRKFPASNDYQIKDKSGFKDWLKDIGAKSYRSEMRTQYFYDKGGETFVAGNLKIAVSNNYKSVEMNNPQELWVGQD